MRKQIVPILAMLALVLGATLAAQSPQPPGHMDTPGATYSTGTVISQSDNAITIQTDAGETRIFLIDQATVGVQDYAVGTRVKVDFIVDDQSRAIAQRIMGHVAGEAASETAAAETEVTATAETEVAEAEPVTSESDFGAETEETAAFDEEDEALPATASPLALLALLGLGGLGAGAGLRIARKRS